MYSAVVVQEVLQRIREPWRWREQWLAIVSWQWQLRSIIKEDPLTTTWEVAEELNVNHSLVIWHLKEIGKVKKLKKWMPHELTENEKKNPSFWSVIFSFSMQQPWTILDRMVMCDKKCILSNNWWSPARWVDQEEAPKYLPTPNLHQKKVIVTVW